MDSDHVGHRGVVQDKTLDHQIQLVFASQARTCLNGEKVYKSDVVVTCNCHRIGTGDMFRSHIGPAPDLQTAWDAYNDPRWHREKENT